MSDDWISVVDVASHHGKRKQTIFKILARLGIETKKLRNSSSKNQLVAYITQDDFRRVGEALLAIVERTKSQASDEGGDQFISADVGVFYLVQLEPEFDPCRFKVGFATSMSERLRALRCSAPFSVVVETWRCRRLWEKTAIDSVAAGSERLHTEVFRAGSLDEVFAKCQRFFATMPSILDPLPMDELETEENRASSSINPAHSPLSEAGASG